MAESTRRASERQDEFDDIRYLAGYIVGTRSAFLKLTELLLSEPIRQGFAAGLADLAAPRFRESHPEFWRGFRESLTELAAALTNKTAD